MTTFPGLSEPWNWLTGNVLSISISEIRNVSILFETKEKSSSNLFLTAINLQLLTFYVNSKFIFDGVDIDLTEN